MGATVISELGWPTLIQGNLVGSQKASLAWLHRGSVCAQGRSLRQGPCTALVALTESVKNPVSVSRSWGLVRDYLLVPSTLSLAKS